MAVTFVTRAGTSLIRRIQYLAPDEVEFMPTEGYTARIQLRSMSGSGRVLLQAQAVTSPDTAVFYQVNESEWRLNLNGDLTRTLPPTTQFEIELVNDLDPTDVRPFFSGVINVTPQGVVTNG